MPSWDAAVKRQYKNLLEVDLPVAFFPIMTFILFISKFALLISPKFLDLPYRTFT